MGAFIDITGKIYGNLKVLERVSDYESPKGYRGTVWKCLCDCGKIVDVRKCNLQSGATTSCGCKRVTNPNRKTHGGKGTRLYKIWKGIKRRCYNVNDARYNDYGGRGINMCGDWKDDFGKFRDWAERSGYTDSLSIDRIDNDLGYYPENCRWATCDVQNNNTRRNHKIEFNGETHTLAEWSAITGIGYHKIKDRINKCKWTIERTLTTP